MEGYSAECPQLNECWSRIRAAQAACRLRKRKQPIGPGVATPPHAAGWPGSVPLSALEKEAVRQWQQVLRPSISLGLQLPHFLCKRRWRIYARLRLRTAPPPEICIRLFKFRNPRMPPPCSSITRGWWALQNWNGRRLPLPRRSFRFPCSVVKILGQRQHQAVARQPGLSENVRRSAKNVVVSFSSSDASDAKCSPFFSGARYLTREGLHVWQGRTVLEQLERAETEVVDDTQGPALPAGVATPGGTHLLKSQSACPFQAFARWRLNAEGLEEGVFSFDARDRGDFLHRALANVWRALKTSARLREMPAAELESVVSDAVTESLASDPVDTTFRVQLRQAESDRLTQSFWNGSLVNLPGAASSGRVISKKTLPSRSLACRCVFGPTVLTSYRMGVLS